MAWKFSDKQGDPVLYHAAPTLLEPIHVSHPLTKHDQAMELLSPYTAHKTLGHFKEPAGTQQEKYRQLLEKSETSTAFMWKCEMTPLEAFTYYYANYLPGAGYPLSCSSMTYPPLEIFTEGDADYRGTKEWL